jgi:hypothetical protein
VGICSLTGNLESLSISFRRGVMTFHGPLDNVDFYASDEEQPSKRPGFLDVFSEKCGSLEARLREDIALGRIERSHAEQLAGMKSCAMFMASSEDGLLSYSFSLMLPQREFEAFARVGERHMGDDVVFLMSFPYPTFADGREQRPPTSAEFYAGAPLIATDMDIDLTFRPVRVVRLDPKNVVRLETKK